LRTLPDCVNSDSFRPAATYDKEELLGLRRSLGIGDGQKVIVYLGLLAEYQGTGLLLEAFRLLRERRPEVTLLLMGFPGIDVYRDRARSLGVDESVIFTGRIPYGDAPRYLALGDAAVAPKLSLTEGAGKILNYMAVGMPVVAFDTPVAREVLGQSGLLARRADVTDLAEKLERSIFDVEAVSLGVALRRRAVAQFDWQQAAEQIVDAYATVLGDKVEPAAAGAVSRGA
jgi:glycosyltransferase involved in cell wall biosynthesis